MNTTIKNLTDALIDITNKKLIPAGAEKVSETSELLMLDILDSLGMVTLLVYIEDHFGVNIPDEEVIPENFKNFQSIAQLIMHHQTSNSFEVVNDHETDSPIKRAIKIVQTNGIVSKEFNLSNGEKLHTLKVEGEKDTWLLIPGLGNPSSSWVTTLQALQEDHNAYAVDFNGFGVSSSHVQRPTFKNHYNAIDELLKQLHQESYIIIGSSAGSMIGMEMARRYPEKIKALIVTGFGLIANPAAWWENLQELSGAPESFLNAAYYRPPEVNETLIGLIQDVMSRPAYWSFLESGGLEEMKNCTANITVPTLFVCGESDKIIPKEAVEAACESIPNSQLEWLSRCGHFPPVEQPEELLYVIKNYLKKL